MDHRWGERLPVSLPVRVRDHAFSVHEGRLTDLSVSGAHLQTTVVLRPFTRVEVTVVLPQRSTYTCPVVAAYVARRYPKGFGLEWCVFAPDGITELLRTAVKHPYSYIRHPIPLASVTRVRLSGALLKHN